MEKKFGSFLCSLFLLMSLSCGTKNLNSSISREWMLVKFKNYDRDVLIKSHARLDMSPTKSPKNQYTANMGCNTLILTGDFKPNGNVKFSDVKSTMMYCDKGMDLEGDFAKSVKTMNHYKLVGQKMILSDGNGQEMEFVAADWD